MKTFLLCLVGLCVWFLCGTIFFRTWIRIRKTSHHRERWTSNAPGWNVSGWHDENTDEWYTFPTAMVGSFFLWLPLTLMIVVRNTALFIYKRGVKPAMIPPKFRPDAVKEAVVMDSAMQVGIQTVNLIAPTDHE